MFFLRDRLKIIRRGVRDFLKSPRTGVRLVLYRRSIRKRDWSEVLRKAEALANIAEARRDYRLMEEMGLAMLRLEQYAKSGFLRLESRRIRRGFPSNEWKGEDISGKTLLINLVEDDAQSLGTTRLVAAAAARAKRCILLAEPRLLPLMRRSFPTVDVRAAGTDTTGAIAEADVFATAAHLIAYLWTSAEVIESSFQPLTPDHALVQSFRDRYRGADAKPLIGISWGSAAFAKETPPLTAWIRLFQSIDAKFVSLQYGQIEDDLAVLRRGHTRPIIHDESVDQLTDMDRFAAQIAAMDGVVTISNTGAHLTGALGVPAVVIIDDQFRRIWPVTSNKIAWYPRTIVVGKNGRNWDAVISEVIGSLDTMSCALSWSVPAANLKA